MNKILGGLIILLALAIGIVPAFTDCASQGRNLTTTTGQTVPMKCHWTGVAEIGVAVPLALVGILTATSKRKDILRTLAAFGVVLGALVILFPTYLIGVCANPMMFCRNAELPALVLSGILAIVLSGVVAFRTRGGGELAA